MTEQEKEKKQSSRILLLLLLLLLLASIGFNIKLSNDVSALKSENEKSEKELVDSESLRKELENELSRVSVELTEYKGKTLKLDSVILQKEAELQQKAAQIKKLLGDNKISYNKYLHFKDEMEDWKYNAEKYLSQVQELSEQNKKLKAEVTELKDEVSTSRKEINKLSDKNAELGIKVAIGAQLKADEINITGVKIRSGGKERETMKYAQMDKLKICFSLPENHVASDGKRVVYIKITDPTGQPIMNEKSGGGTFMIDNKQAKYTDKQQITYDNMPKSYCLYWDAIRDINLVDGTYTMELFTDGYKMGEKNFTLK